MTKLEFETNFPTLTVDDLKLSDLKQLGLVKDTDETKDTDGVMTVYRNGKRLYYEDGQKNLHNNGGKHLYKLSDAAKGKTVVVETLNAAAAAKLGIKHDGELWQSDEGRRGAGDGKKKAAISTAEKTAAAIAAKIKEATAEVTMTDEQRKRIETAAAAIASAFKEITDAEKTAAAAAAEKTAFVDAWTKKGMDSAAAGAIWDEWTADSAAAIAQLCAVGMTADAAAKVLAKQGAKLAKRAAADETPKA